MSLAGRVFSNRYEIEREIAQGGMAEVYLARDQSLDRPVALKALFPEYAREPSFVERFRREAQAAANLNHPNIVAIYDWGQEAGHVLHRDGVRRGPLAARPHSYRRRRSIADQAAEITAEIASALAFAHRSGVVHRDVKPGNVLLTQSGHGEGHRLRHRARRYERRAHADRFGDGHRDVLLARAGAGPRRSTAAATCTPLGVVLYEMVCGVAPFTGDSPVAVAYKHVREDAIPPAATQSRGPARPRADHPDALAKDPDHRYQTRRRPARRPPALPPRPPARGRAGHRDRRRGSHDRDEGDAGSADAYAATMATPAVDDRGTAGRARRSTRARSATPR